MCSKPTVREVLFDPRYRCEHCDYRTWKRKTLNTHRVRKHFQLAKAAFDERWFSSNALCCRWCLKFFKRRRQVRRHERKWRESWTLLLRRPYPERIMMASCLPGCLGQGMLFLSSMSDEQVAAFLNGRSIVQLVTENK